MVLNLIALGMTILVFALAFAHVAEWPGKARLARDDYLTVQSIFFPGFTVVGALTELPALAVLVVAAVTDGFGALRLGSLLALVAVNVCFWTVVQPVNRHWNMAGRALNGSAPGIPHHATRDSDEVWRAWRRRWEIGHAVRAVCAAFATGCLVAAIAEPALPEAPSTVARDARDGLPVDVSTPRGGGFVIQSTRR